MRSAVITTVFAAAIALATVAAGEAHAPAAGAHTMDGKVTKVDAKKGWIDVKTPKGAMKPNFPPPALDSVKTGDSVTIELGMSASESADTTKSDGTMIVHSPPADLQTMKKGDRITVSPPRKDNGPAPK